MQLIDGKIISAQMLQELASVIQDRKKNGLKLPHLAALLVGENGASKTYVAHKVKACAQVGMNSTVVELPDTITEEQLLHEIALLNHDSDIDGYIVQLPLPKQIDEQKVLNAIHPDKDVDGFHPVNIGRMTLDLPSFLPATPHGILELLERYHIETSGKNVLIIGRSHIVGRPLSILMSQKRPSGDATVTLAHSKTKNLSELTQKADIIVAALGSPEFLTGEMVRDGVVIIDVGITRIHDASSPKGYRIVGDVHFDSVSPKTSFITPVPGGVGPMTIAMLLKNTLQACQLK